MPKGGRKHEAIATVASATDFIDLTEAPGPFHLGDVVHIVFGAADPTGIEAMIAVQVQTGGFVRYSVTSGEAITLGPTPTWGDPQPGTLTLELLRWSDQGPAVDFAGFDTVLIGPTYEVVA